jgi:hypothetical protein
MNGEAVRGGQRAADAENLERFHFAKSASTSSRTGEEFMDLSKREIESLSRKAAGNPRAPELTTVTRRDWIKMTVGGGAGLALSGLLDSANGEGRRRQVKTRERK